MSTTRTIIVQCPRQYTTHAKLTVSREWLTVEYGTFAGERFFCATREEIYLKENPELETLHDGYGWNPEALFSLVSCLHVLDTEDGFPVQSVEGIGELLTNFRAKQKA